MLSECEHLNNSDLINESVDYYDKVKGYCIRGCCGGGCWVIEGIKFCPFCGIKLDLPTNGSES